MRKESGQSTVEFLLSFTLILGFLFSFMSLAFSFTNGYLLHYATYMASRAYMVFDDDNLDPQVTDQAARNWSNQAFEKYKLDLLINSFEKLEFNDPSNPSFQGRASNLYVGVWTDITQSFLIPVITKSLGLNLRSESFLGKEPTKGECYQQICEAMKSVGAEGCVKHVTVADNGC